MTKSFFTTVFWVLWLHFRMRYCYCNFYKASLSMLNSFYGTYCVTVMEWVNSLKNALNCLLTTYWLLAVPTTRFFGICYASWSIRFRISRKSWRNVSSVLHVDSYLQPHNNLLAVSKEITNTVLPLLVVDNVVIMTQSRISGIFPRNFFFIYLF